MRKFLFAILISAIFTGGALAQSGVGLLPAFNVAGNPTASAAPPTAFPIFSTANTWTVLQTITPTANFASTVATDGSIANTNNFPKTSYFGGNIVGVYNSFTGAVDVPNTSTLVQVNGLSAYCRSAATIITSSGSPTACVASFGWGMISAAGTSTWGGNFGCTNAPTNRIITNTGFNFLNCVGTELDVNIIKTAGLAPTGSAYGLLVNSASEIQPTVGYAGVLVAAAAQPWKSAIAIGDASASNFAVEIGSSTAGNGANSMSVVWETRTAGGAPISGTILLDPLANLVANVSFISTGAALQHSPVSGSALFNMISPASQQGVTKYFAVGTLKWTLGKDTDDSFFILDSTSALKPFLVSAAGAVSVGETGKNLNLIGTPIQVNGVSGVSTVCTITAGNSYTFTNGVLTTKGANCT